MRPSSSSRWCALIAVALTAASIAHAQNEVSGSGPVSSGSSDRPVGEYWAARLRYGLTYRNGTQNDLGPGLSYSGLTENDLALNLWGWYGYVGGYLAVQREGFSLNDTTSSTVVTQGGALRLAAQVAGRFPLGPIRLEPYVGYSFNQLPTFGSSFTPTYANATRHAILLAARVLVDVGPVEIEARGELPLALATSVPGATNGVSQGYGVGGGVRVQLFNVSKVHFGALLDAQYLSDTVYGSNPANTVNKDILLAKQSVFRGGISLDVQYKEVARVSTTGGVLVKVFDVDTGGPIVGADVTLTSNGSDRRLSPEGDGVLAARDLAGGQFTLKAAAGGYLPFESTGTVTLGVDTPVELKLKKEPPKVGSLSITVKEIDTNKPLAGVTLTLGDVTAKTNESGVAKVDNLNPGPVAIALSLEGYQKGEEAASVIAGKTSEVPVTLVPEKKRVPATIKGLVRSAKGGTAIAADLELPQAKIKTKANAAGEFTFRVEGGTYTVKISAPGYITQTKDVSVKDGDQAIFNVDLYPK